MENNEDKKNLLEFAKTQIETQNELEELFDQHNKEKAPLTEEVKKEIGEFLETFPQSRDYARLNQYMKSFSANNTLDLQEDERELYLRCVYAMLEQSKIKPHGKVADQEAWIQWHLVNSIAPHLMKDLTQLGFVSNRNAAFVSRKGGAIPLLMAVRILTSGTFVNLLRCFHRNKAIRFLAQHMVISRFHRFKKDFKWS